MAAPSQAADKALLIGVDRYPQLPQRLWLRGPSNDVTLMRSALLQQGFAEAHIQTLVDAPSRAQILAAMQAMLAHTTPGDRLLFYFAGHGSQQPQPAGRLPVEPDGLDEVLLPADVAAWDGHGSQASIAHAIVDDEIGAWIDALVDRGAVVWALFDTCHAAGMTRSTSTGYERAIHPHELGLKLSGASAKTAPRQSRGRQDGRVLLFAGRSHERVREEWMPRGANLAQARMHGVFTWHVASLLPELGMKDPEALLAAVRQRYEQEQRSQPLPMLSGALANTGKH
ncbi:caspase family protein [Roseateles aquae]|nr:caspase family protein [Paucibacter sp. APW11]